MPKQTLQQLHQKIQRQMGFLKAAFLDIINSVLFVKMNSPSKRGEMNLLDYTQYEWDIIGIGSLTDSMELNLILH